MGASRPEVRRERSAFYALIFETLSSQGRSHVWLARQLGISRTVLANYAHGWVKPPSGLMERACTLLGLPVSVVAGARDGEHVQAPHEERRVATNRRNRATRGTSTQPQKTPRAARGTGRRSA